MVETDALVGVGRQSSLDKDVAGDVQSIGGSNVDNMKEDTEEQRVKSKKIAGAMAGE